MRNGFEKTENYRCYKVKINFVRRIWVKIFVFKNWVKKIKVLKCWCPNFKVFQSLKFIIKLEKFLLKNLIFVTYLKMPKLSVSQWISVIENRWHH